MFFRVLSLHLGSSRWPGVPHVCGVYESLSTHHHSSMLFVFPDAGSKGSTSVFSPNLGLLDSFLKTWFRLSVLDWSCFKITDRDAYLGREVRLPPGPSCALLGAGQLLAVVWRGVVGRRRQAQGLQVFLGCPVSVSSPTLQSSLLVPFLSLSLSLPRGCLAWAPGSLSGGCFFQQTCPPSPFHAEPSKDSSRNQR